jgi:hypothetical protein
VKSRTGLRFALVVALTVGLVLRWVVFMQQVYGDNPSMISVAMASSGYPDLGWLPNNAAGFAQALVQLRNWCAPNVILAWHASIWG